MNRLAIDGGTPLYNAEWPAWPPPIDGAQRALVNKVLDSGLWSSSSGHLCDQFAGNFADYHEAEYGVPLVNGTIALFVALRGAGVGPGDEVVIPAYTFVACATSVLLLGATPVIADVDPDHLHLSSETVEAALSTRTRAIMVVHLAGSPAPMDEIMGLATKHDLVVIEDAAQAHGARYRGQPVGGIGDLGTFSFQSSKAMTAGEGGLVTTNNALFAERVWSLCNVGRRRGGAWYGHVEIGWNLRMTEMQAALLLPWLSHLDTQISRREAFVNAFREGLSERDVPAAPIAEPEGTTRNSHHLLIVRLAPEHTYDREWIVRSLAAEGVPVEPGYPHLSHIDAVAPESRVLATPGLDSVAESLLWIRQPVLMADEEAATLAAASFARVLKDPRAMRVDSRR